MLSELVAGQDVVPVGVDVAVVDPLSTVESVWVCVRPEGTTGVVLAFVPALVVSVACLATVLLAGLCGVAALALALWAWSAAPRCAVAPRAAPPLGVADGCGVATVAAGLGTEATRVTSEAA